MRTTPARTRAVWTRITELLKPKTWLRTPGRGIPPKRQAKFLVESVTSNAVTILIGGSRTRNRLPATVFNAVVSALDSSRLLRIAAVHNTVPTPNSVDEVVRTASGKQRAIGNYVAAILEHVGIVEYVMVKGQKSMQKHVVLRKD